MKRSKAIAKAIDESKPGDLITIHRKGCTGCSCRPIELIRPRKNQPVGFRPR